MRVLSYLNVILVLVLMTGCSSSIYGWQVRTMTTPVSTAFDPVVFHRQPVAILGALAPPGLRGNEVGIDYLLGQIMRKVAPQIELVTPLETITRINEQRLAAEYVKMRADAEQSNVLDRDSLRKLASAIGAHYVFQPRLAAFSQTMTDRWKIPAFDVRVSQTRSSNLRLSLQLWNAQTGELVWYSVAEETMQSEAFAQDPVYMEDAVRLALGSMVADFLHHKTASTYTSLNKIIDTLIQIPLPEQAEGGKAVPPKTW